MEKYILMLTLFALGCQSREYFYQKPLAPFYPEDGSRQPQYVTTSHRMIIPGTNGRNYEVSMSPARHIFQMHLERLQHYGQPNQVYSQQLSEYLQGSGGQSAGGYAQSQVQHAVGNGVNYGQYQGNQQSSGSYAGQQSGNQGVYGQAHNQQTAGYAGASNIQQNAAGYAAQSAAYAQSHSQGNSGYAGAQQHSGAYAQSGNQGAYAQQNAGYTQTHGQQNAGNAAQSYYTQNGGAVNQYQHSQANGQPISRQVRKCYPNGNCEYITDDREHQQVLQQARSSFIPVGPKCNKPAHVGQSQGHAQGQSQRHTSTPTTGVSKGLRDRRLFPYSEVPISRYPNKK